MKVQFELKKNDLLKSLALMNANDEQMDKVLEKFEHTETLEIKDDIIEDLDEGKAGFMYAISVLAVAAIAKEIDEQRKHEDSNQH